MSADINPEFAYFLNPAKIAEGTLLFDKNNPTQGRVIFSLTELPENDTFLNDKGTEITRLPDSKAKITVKNQPPIILTLVDLSKEKTKSTQELNLEKEIELLDDREKLSFEGIKLMELETGVGKHIFALRELPLNRKFVTYHGNKVERISLSEVKIEETVLEIKVPRARSSTISVPGQDRRMSLGRDFMEVFRTRNDSRSPIGSPELKRPTSSPVTQISEETKIRLSIDLPTRRDSRTPMPPNEVKELVLENSSTSSLTESIDLKFSAEDVQKLRSSSNGSSSTTSAHTSPVSSRRPSESPKMDIKFGKKEDEDDQTNSRPQSPLRLESIDIEKTPRRKSNILPELSLSPRPENAESITIRDTTDEDTLPTPEVATTENSIDIDLEPMSVVEEEKEEQDEPKVHDIKLTGGPYHTTPLQVLYTFSGGKEGDTLFHWEKSSGNGNFVPIAAPSKNKIFPSIDIVGHEIRVTVTPVRDDWVEGKSVHSNTVLVLPDPKIWEKGEQLLHKKKISLEVSIKSGEDTKDGKHDILKLYKDKFKIINKKGVVLIQREWGNDIEVLPKERVLFRFTTKDQCYIFEVSSSDDRDMFVLVIRKRLQDALRRSSAAPPPPDHN